MPSAALLLAMVLRHPSPADAGVWLDPLPHVVTAPLRVTGRTQAPEGVLHVSLYVGDLEVATYEPALPVGEIPFAFTWTPTAPGTYTVRVVATTLLRGVSAEADGLVVPAPSRPKPVAVRHVVAVAKPLPHRRSVAVALPAVDDSGAAFGEVAPTLPYVRRVAAPVTPATIVPAVEETERSGWVSVAGGLVVLLVCSHLHRSLRKDT
jgi:hypothetical protein